MMMVGPDDGYDAGPAYMYGYHTPATTQASLFPDDL
jgi:hypothetical protein